MLASTRYLARGYHLAVEAWCHAGLQQVVTRKVGVAGNQVRVFGRLKRRENRREAHIRALHQRAPLSASTAGEQLGEMPVLLGPEAAVPLVGETRFTLQTQLVQQQRVELRLDRPQGDECPIGAAIGGIER
ncbi:hypothetical protein D3C84_686160 [compost metagenome]